MRQVNETPAADVSFREALGVWCQVALQSFGGPAGQIAVMHRILVERKKWIDEDRFLHALNYCMLLPGPEAQQLATYIGWLMHGVRGGLAAGLLFITPGIAAILALSVVYVELGHTIVVPALFFGLKAAVSAVVFEAVHRISKRALKSRPHYLLAAASFVAIFLFDVPFPLIIIAAALLGWLALPIAPAGAPSASTVTEERVRPSFVRSIGVLAVWLVVWWGPQLIVLGMFGPAHVFVREGLFFSQAAMVTFGGAYSVLTYIAQRAVETYGWLSPRETLDGLGMAETTPGPLIMVVQFVGFLAAYRFAPEMPPLAAGICGALLTTWVTFAPCFLWIFLGAPYIETLRNNRALTRALSGITAAVVGVILNLAIWFLLHVLFAGVEERHFGVIRYYLPVWSTFDVAAATIAAGACWLLLWARRSVGLVLAAGTACGALVYWFANRPT